MLNRRLFLKAGLALAVAAPLLPSTGVARSLNPWPTHPCDAIRMHIDGWFADKESVVNGPLLQDSIDLRNQVTGRTFAINYLRPDWRKYLDHVLGEMRRRQEQPDFMQWASIAPKHRNVTRYHSEKYVYAMHVPSKSNGIITIRFDDASRVLYDTTPMVNIKTGETALGQYGAFRTFMYHVDETGALETVTEEPESYGFHIQADDTKGNRNPLAFSWHKMCRTDWKRRYPVQEDEALAVRERLNEKRAS